MLNMYRIAQSGGRGRLRVGCFVNDAGHPVSGARVTVTPRGNAADIIEILNTDNSGLAEDIDLAAPPLEYSLNAEQSARPYDEYDVAVEAEGFEPAQIAGVQVLPDRTAIQNVILRPRADTGTRALVEIPENTLWGSFPPKIPEEEVKPLPPSEEFVVLPDPVIPEFIVVHAGAPSNASAPNYWVPFKDYVKNVASSEIYATWPETTIMANVLAILSFTLNRVYTEWYRGKGYDFTITNSTAFDHAFTYGRNIYDTISQVVDDVFTSFVTKPNIRQPLFTQYCDGRQVACPNWMTQWGSKTLGDQGWSAINILKNYYGQDIYLERAAKVEGVPSSYPGAPLQSGSSGEAVRTIQQQLNAVSNNYPAIPKLRVDGVFGADTVGAVQTFQRIFNLPSSGIVDFPTWYEISNIYVAVTRLAELR